VSPGDELGAARQFLVGTQEMLIIGMSRPTALNSRQVIFGKFPKTQNFKCDNHYSYIYMPFIKQLNLKRKNNEL